MLKELTVGGHAAYRGDACLVTRKWGRQLEFWLPICAVRQRHLEQMTACLIVSDWYIMGFPYPSRWRIHVMILGKML